MKPRSPGSTSGALGGAVLCSLPAALPALIRVWPDGNGAWAAAALVGASSLSVVPLGLWLRRAAEGGLPRADQALLAGAALSALPLALFGGVLKSTTHHRPLGGATFAVAALCVLLACIGLAFRVFRTMGHAASKSPWQKLFTLGCGLSLASVLLLGSASATRPSLLDFLALSVAAAVAGLAPLPTWLSRAKWPVVLGGWGLLLACALFSLTRPQVVGSLTTQAPVSFAALSWLGDSS